MTQGNVVHSPNPPTLSQQVYYNSIASSQRPCYETKQGHQHLIRYRDSFLPVIQAANRKQRSVPKLATYTNRQYKAQQPRDSSLTYWNDWRNNAIGTVPLIPGWMLRQNCPAWNMKKNLPRISRITAFSVKIRDAAPWLMVVLCDLWGGSMVNISTVGGWEKLNQKGILGNRDYPDPA